jgi:hypothetical protein
MSAGNVPYMQKFRPTFDPVQVSNAAHGSLSGADGASVVSAAAASEERLVMQTQTYIAAKSAQERIHLLPFFSDFDPHKHGFISDTQAARALASAGFPELSRPQIAALTKFYAVDKFDTKRINYRALLNDVAEITVRLAEKRELDAANAHDAPVLEKRAVAAEWKNTNTFTERAAVNAAIVKPKADVSFDKTMRKIHTEIQRRRLSMQAFFADFDTHRRFK